MPKPKPDQVIRHEIVFGRSERELIEGALVAYQVNKVSTPLVALVSDISAMTIVFSAVSVYLGFKFEIFQNGYADMSSLVNDFLNQYNAFKETVAEYSDVASTAGLGVVGALPGGKGLQALLNILLGSNNQSMYDTSNSGGGGGGSF